MLCLEEEKSALILKTRFGKKDYSRQVDKWDREEQKVWHFSKYTQSKRKSDGQIKEWQNM